MDSAKALYVDEVLQIQEDWVIEGLCSNRPDVLAIFFGTLHIQDHPPTPTQAYNGN